MRGISSFTARTMSGEQMNKIRVLAAGSLRLVWPVLVDAFEKQHPPLTVETLFGPAGLLRQRFEQGERCDLFASANVAHPHTLLQEGNALSVSVFTSNRLCLTLLPHLKARSPLDLLSDPNLRIATSTPLSDPSGDYTWQLFDRIEQQHPEVGNGLKKRALQLVGGAQSSPVPPDEVAGCWLLKTGQADIFIGYRSYAQRVEQDRAFALVDLPESWQIRADYAFAMCEAKARPLANFLLSPRAQEILQASGFDQIRKGHPLAL